MIKLLPVLVQSKKQESLLLPGFTLLIKFLFASELDWACKGKVT